MEHRQNTTNTFGKTFLKDFIEFFEKFYYSCHILFKGRIEEYVPIFLSFFYLSTGLEICFLYCQYTSSYFMDTYCGGHN